MSGKWLQIAVCFTLKKYWDFTIGVAGAFRWACLSVLIVFRTFLVLVCIFLVSVLCFVACYLCKYGGVLCVCVVFFARPILYSFLI
jgi:hypothetical protein